MPLSIDYDSPGKLRALLEERGLGMRKKFGQNFLVNPAARRELLEALEINAGDRVWEIGPGLGAMTGGLLERGARLTAFEVDPGFCGILRELFGEQENFRLVEGDVFKTWAGEAEDGEPYLFGNLPYNAGASLLGDFIEKGRFFRRMVVTVQREVAERMAAKPGSPEYSSFSVLCSSAYTLKLLKVIKGASFYPVPRVESRGVRLDLLPPGERARPPLFYPLVRALFSSRRKTIKNSLSAFIHSGILQETAGVGVCRTSCVKPQKIADQAIFYPANSIGPKVRSSPIISSPIIGDFLRHQAQKIHKHNRLLDAEGILRRANLSGERRPETLDIGEFTRLAAALEVL